MGQYRRTLIQSAQGAGLGFLINRPTMMGKDDFHGHRYFASLYTYDYSKDRAVQLAATPVKTQDVSVQPSAMINGELRNKIESQFVVDVQTKFMDIVQDNAVEVAGSHIIVVSEIGTDKYIDGLIRMFTSRSDEVQITIGNYQTERINQFSVTKSVVDGGARDPAESWGEEFVFQPIFDATRPRTEDAQLFRDACWEDRNVSGSPSPWRTTIGVSGGGGGGGGSHHARSTGPYAKGGLIFPSSSSHSHTL